jgi:hypothetical protein
MPIAWRTIWNNRRNWFKAGVLLLGAWVTLYVTLILPVRQIRSNTMQKGTGLASPVEGLRHRVWQRQRLATGISTARVAALSDSSEVLGYIGGVPGSVPAEQPEESGDRKIVRTASLDLVVKSPSDTAEKIRTLAERMGGYLVSSEMRGSQFGPGGTITIRVPAPRFEEARGEIKKLAFHIENERIEANDVTKEYVDKEARLRNLRAQEQQYLAILRRAATVKDTLEVSEKLDAIRAQIEVQQAEFLALSKQVETVALSITLRTEADTQVLGIHWRPLYELKVAAHDGLDSLANYVTAMVAAIFQLPAIALWAATVILVLAVAWRILRWVWRTFFRSPNPAAGPVVSK